MTIHAYADRPERPSDQVEIKFLQTLIDKAIEQGCITQDDIQNAIESCGVQTQYEWGMYTADEIIEKLKDTGSKLIGTLDNKQAAQLRKLRNLCLSYAKGNNALLWHIHNLWRTNPR
jgi:hypothetical protein